MAEEKNGGSWANVGGASDSDDPKPKADFGDEDVEKWLRRGAKHTGHSSINMVLYGHDGTGKTGAAMDCRTQVQKERGEKLIVYDLDGSAGPIKEKYHGDDENIVIFDPFEVHADGKIDYVTTYNKILVTTRYLVQNEGKLELAAVVFDGLDTLLKTCVPEGTMITMDDLRARPIESLSIGDGVATRQGKSTIEAISTQTKPVIDIQTARNKLTVTHDHPVFARKNYWGYFQWIKAGELQPGYHMAMLLPQLDVPSTHLTLAQCELLGHLVAEGNISGRYSPGYSNTYPERFKELLSETFPELELNFTHAVHYNIVKKTRGNKPNSLKEWLKQLGLWGTLSHTVFVPDAVKYGSKKQLQAFMEGYLFGDGYISRERTQAYSVSPQLRDDLEYIFWRLGYIANRHGGAVNVDYLKSGRVYNPKNYRGTIFADRITNIEEAGKAEVIDLTVSPYHEFAANRLVVHNCEFVMRHIDLKVDPNVQIKDSWQWSKRNRHYNTVVMLLKRMKCDKIYTTHLKAKMSWKKIGDKSELVVDSWSPDWEKMTPGMMFQKVLMERREIVGEDTVEFTAKVEKAKGALELEGKEYMVAVKRSDEVVWNGIHDMLEGFRGKVEPSP